VKKMKPANGWAIVRKNGAFAIAYEDERTAVMDCSEDEGEYVVPVTITEVTEPPARGRRKGLGSLGD
jgi:hypothetical protein